MAEKQQATKPKKSIWRKLLWLWILLSVLGTIILAVVVWQGIVNYSPDDGWYGNGKSWSKTDAFTEDYYNQMLSYTFNDARSDGKLRIMQLADPQLKLFNDPADKKTIELVGVAIDKMQPDLVVVTGDLTLSVFPRATVKKFCEFLEDKQVYWTFTYGNHDSEFSLSKYRHSQLFANYKYCLFDGGPSTIKGESNYFVNIKDGGGKLLYALCMVDSNMYPEDRTDVFAWEYDELHQTQVDWYAWSISGLQSIRPDVKSSVFMHIPLARYNEVYASGAYVGQVDEAPKKDENGNQIGAGIYHQGGGGGEAFYNQMLALGSSTSVFCGHDHINTMRGTTSDNLLMAYGRCCGYHTYPFFETQTDSLFEKLISDIFGYTGKTLYLDQWVDENGNPLGKGVSMIEIDVSNAATYGNIRMYDVNHDYLLGKTTQIQNEIFYSAD